VKCCSACATWQLPLLGAASRVNVRVEHANFAHTHTSNKHTHVCIHSHSHTHALTHTTYGTAPHLMPLATHDEVARGHVPHLPRLVVAGGDEDGLGGVQCHVGHRHQMALEGVRRGQDGGFHHDNSLHTHEGGGVGAPCWPQY